MLPGSAIVKGKSLNVLSSQEGRAARLHGKRRQPPTAPLQALRGHSTTAQFLCPPKRQLSYHLGGRERRGAKGESAPAPEKVQISTSPLRGAGKSRHRRLRVWKAGMETESSSFAPVEGGMSVSAPSDGKKSWQDTGFTILSLLSVLTFFFSFPWWWQW